MAPRAARPVVSVEVLATIVAATERRPRDARKLLEALVASFAGRVTWPRPVQPSLQMRWLGPEWQQFRCVRLRCTMPIRDCLELRAAEWPSGRRKGCPKRRECVGCEQGAANAAAVPGYVTKPASQAPEMLPPAQRAAKARLDLESLPVDDGGALSAMQEAQMLTPDDATDWRA